MNNRITSMFAGLLVLAFVASSAIAQTIVVVKNDQLPDDLENDFTGCSCVIPGAFNFGEEQNAFLTAPCSGTIIEIQILAGGGNGYNGQSVESSLGLYEFGSCSGLGDLNRSGTALVQPGFGPAVFGGPVLTVQAGAEVASLNRFLFVDEGQTVPLAVPVTAGQQFVISFRWGNDWCTDACAPSCGVCTTYFGPGIVHDGLGSTQCKNGIFGPPFGLDAFDFPIGGNFVMRALILCDTADGACCLPDASCVVLSPSTCLASLGVFQGPATDCVGAGCTVLQGACCLESSCINTTQVDCINNLSGTWLGPALDCNVGDPCNLNAVGACCIDASTCWPAQLTQSDCETVIGGTWKGPATDCVLLPSICIPIGACCFSTGGCLDGIAEADCLLSPGATWLGEGTVCAGDGPPDSACLPSCPADCAGGGDGFVNVTDLLDLLAGWGSAGACDISPPGGDGTINVTDLLDLLAAWGPCP